MTVENSIQKLWWGGGNLESAKEEQRAIKKENCSDGREDRNKEKKRRRLRNMWGKIKAAKRRYRGEGVMERGREEALGNRSCYLCIPHLLNNKG